MKASTNFKQIIQDHLKGVAQKDPVFAEKLISKDKNIDDCITYIFNQVKKSGCTGFADEEIFGMAIHYYDEKDIKPGKSINANVVVNRAVELTPEDIEKAKQEAKDKVIAQEMERLRKKPKKAIPADKPVQTSLFE